MATEIDIGGISALVTFKQIKHVHLRVHPPDGEVRISAPARMQLETVRNLALGKLGWIQRQRQRLRANGYERPLDYKSGEAHWLWGRCYPLLVSEQAGPPAVTLHQGQIRLQVRPGSGRAAREALVSAWYREQVRAAAQPLIARWEPAIGRRVSRLYVRRMKTRWGSCNPRRESIRLNSELAKQRRECLEYVVVHELVHLIEPSHNQVFKQHMSALLPEWRQLRAELNGRG